jgi:hypothetical protein
MAAANCGDEGRLPGQICTLCNFTIEMSFVLNPLYRIAMIVGVVFFGIGAVAGLFFFVFFPFQSTFFGIGFFVLVGMYLYLEIIRVKKGFK